MKNFLTFLISISCLLPGLLQGQSYDYVTGFGFNTLPNILTPLADGRWLAVGTGNAMPGLLYSDTVAALVFDSEANVSIEEHLFFPSSEVSRVQSATGMQDGGFAIAVAENLCDADFNQTSLLAYDATGALKWSKQGNDLNRLLRVSSDGYLVTAATVGNSGLTAYDPDNGALAWSATLNSFGAGFYFRDFALTNGGNTIVAVGNPGLQRWDRVNANTFALSRSEDFTQFYATKKMVFAAGLGYTFVDNGHELYRFSPDTLGHTLIGNYPFTLIDLTTTATNLVALVYQGASDFVVNIDFQGQIIDTVKILAPSLKGAALSYENGVLATLGINGSGPIVPTGNPFLLFNAHQLWLNTDYLSGEPSLETANTQAVQVSQNSPVTVDSVLFAQSNHYIFKYSGGQFQLEVKNLGDTPLESIDAHIGFDWVDNFCSFRPAITRHFSGLAVQPNESVWLNFGDVQASQQSEHYTQFCFWTSAPNHLPDAVPENDIVCIDIHTVDTKEPEKALFKLLPNPANESFQVSFPETRLKGAWQLNDLVGRNIKAGVLEPGTTALNINTASMPSGVYQLSINGVCLKVVVTH